jgi:hypothetical protein
MKKILPFILILFLVVGCQGGNKAPSDVEMATRVAQILTQMPPSATEILPTPTVLAQVAEAPTETTAPTATTAPTETIAPTEAPLPTDTLAPSATPNLTTTPQTGGGGPTPTTGSPTAPATATVPVGPTFTPPATDPRTKLGAATSTDPMDAPDKWVWPTGANDFTSISFGNGVMSLTGLTQDSGWRLPLTQNAPNMYIEMTARPTGCTNKDRDNYGIIFRVPVFKEADRGYLFGVSCDGYFALWKWDGKVDPKGKATMLSLWKKNAAIASGPEQTNRLGVYAYDDRLILYANGVLLGEARDSTYTSGSFGVFVNPDSVKNFTVKIDEMNYWLNPPAP